MNNKAKKGKAPQDSGREKRTAALLGLVHNPRSRDGSPDCRDADGNPFELKSTTADTVTSARDWGFNQLERGRSKYWVVVRTDGSGPDMTATGHAVNKDFQVIYFLHPAWLEPFFKETEDLLLENTALLSEMAKSYAEPQGSLTEKEKAIFKRLWARACGSNCPSIKMGLVRQVGKLVYLNSQNPFNQPELELCSASEILSRLIKEYPLGTPLPTRRPVNPFGDEDDPDEEVPMIDFAEKSLMA